MPRTSAKPVSKRPTARRPRALTLAAALAATDDARVSDAELSAAIASMGPRARDELVAAWRERAGRGDDALVVRLLGMFEHAALRARTADELAPYARALHAVAGRAHVFAHLEPALASENAVVREAVCAWLCELDALAAFDDAQIDKLVRCVVAIAETGDDDAADRRAALRALAACGHPGARRALFDAVRKPALRAPAYAGLARVHHPDVLPFLVERAFVERDEYRALMTAIASVIDPHVHRRVVDMLVARARDADACHAAALYADVLAATKPSPRLLVELARAVLAWTPRTNDDARRLRHVIEQALVAAIAIGQPPDARAFAARARELPDAPYSDYHVKVLDHRTPSPLTDAKWKARLAALASGALDRELAAARETAAAARAAGKPIALADAKLGALAGGSVASRFVEDRKTKEVWFWDAGETMHVYDGFALVPPPCTITRAAFRGGINGREIADWLGGAERIDERVAFVPKPHARVKGRAREIMRLGDRVLVFEAIGGRGAGARWPVEPIGLGFPDEPGARRVFALLAADPPAGTASIDPARLVRAYQLPGGSVVAAASPDDELRALAAGARIVSVAVAPAKSPPRRRSARSRA